MARKSKAAPSSAQFRAAEAAVSGRANATEREISATLAPIVDERREAIQQARAAQVVNKKVNDAERMFTKAELDAAIEEARKKFVEEKTGPSAEQRSAFALLKDQLASWGLADLSDWAIGLYQSENAPVDYNEFYALMKQQPVYQERFGKTNAARTAAGLAQLTEGQIMDLENSYKKTMQAYGLPATFYDSPEDYRKFIAADISAAELADRVQAADSYVKALNPQIRSQLNSYYGINDGALAAAALDPKKGQDILQQLASRTTTAIAAGTAGLGTDYAKQAEAYGAGQLGFAKQAQGFAQAAQAGARGGVLSQIYERQGATPYGTEQAVAETFGAPTSVQEAEKRKRLAKMEVAQFSGASGAGQGALSGTSEAGML